MATPPFGSTKCRNCKGTGLDPHMDRDCEMCKGEGWITPGRPPEKEPPKGKKGDEE